MELKSPKRSPENLSRIPSLDGIRAIAIALVIYGHTVTRFGNPSPFKAEIERTGLLWPDGVGIFFVLSGFLITTLLLREYDRSGTISIRKFYLRRCFRILPPFYAYIGFVLVFFCWIHPIQVQWKSFTMAAVFLRDYGVRPDFWATDHLWSLGVEEQFYLLWPALLYLGLRFGGRRAASKIAITCILLAPALRVGGKLAGIQFFHDRVGEMFHCRMDSLMCGCLLAILIGNPRFESGFARISKFWWCFFLYVFVLDGELTQHLGVHYRLTIGYTINAIAIALMLLWAMRNAGSPVGRILNNRLMVTAGVLSYSAYLWQTFFIRPENTSVLARMPYALVWIWVAAWLSYHFVEQPALRMRDRVLQRMKRKLVVQSA